MQEDLVPGVTDLTVIATGRSAVVYRAKQSDASPHKGRVVAVKVLHATVSDAQRIRFERESRAIASLAGHGHVAIVHDAGLTADGRPYVVMEHLPRRLTELLGERGTLRWQEAVALGTEVASALTAAHGVGVLHREVDPSNILLASGDVPKLADFGLARYAAGGSPEAATDDARLSHAAPEVVQGKPIDERTDVYSLAATLHGAITGSAPFAAGAAAGTRGMMDRVVDEPPASLEGFGVPATVEAVILAGMAKDPGKRPPTAAMFSQQLLSAAKSAGEATGAITRPAAAGAAAATATAAATGVGGAATGLAGLARSAGPSTAGAPGARGRPRVHGEPGVPNEATGGGQGPRRRTTSPARRWPALAGFGLVAALVIAGLAWIVGRSGDDDAADTTGVTTTVASTESTAATTATTAAAATTTATTPQATTAPATNPPTTASPTAAPTSAGPSGVFRIIEFRNEDGTATFRIPADGVKHTFPYEVLVGGLTADQYCPVRSGLTEESGPGLSDLDLGECFVPGDPPNELTVRAFGAGTTTFTFWVCNGESLGGVCPEGTKSINGTEITVIAD